MAPQFGNRDWRSIAHQVSKEMEPAKLMVLVGELCCALEDERREKSDGSHIQME
jgi:hypothetical protein